MYYFNIDENGILLSWFDEALAKLDINNKDKAIKVNEDLFYYLMNLTQHKFKNISDINLEKIYALDDVPLFEEIGLICHEIDINYISNEERINAALLLETAEKEIRIKYLESDIANVILEMVSGGK